MAQKITGPEFEKTLNVIPLQYTTAFPPFPNASIYADSIGLHPFTLPYTLPTPLGADNMPSTIDGFLSTVFPTLTSTQRQDFEQALVQDYLALVYPTNEPLGSAGNWKTALGFTDSGVNSDVDKQFKAWFQTFLSSFPFSDYLTPPATTLTDFEPFRVEMISQLTVTTDPTTTASSATLYPRYKEIFDQLFPTAGNAGFTAALKSFYDDHIATNGFFIPSYSLPEWTLELSKQYVKALGAGNLIAGTSSIASANFGNALILNRIYSLITGMLTSMQKVAIVQSKRLNTLTQWQKAYTDALSQIHVFVSGDTTRLGHALGGDDTTTLTNTRNSLNNNVNASLRGTLENNRNVVADDAKSLQSSINQSTDAVSQQANIATTIMQELNTILSAIFRG